MRERKIEKEVDWSISMDGERERKRDEVRRNDTVGGEGGGIKSINHKEWEIIETNSKCRGKCGNE